ncbi:CYTH domain-containing protein [Domibacillus enclensis]|uniref:Adenylate cyclase n=1 Tax=Domibacillus enclensis TaxID=1017273 RepID=A0A1N7AVA5_9BACI|nr:CYTH domain-containing protein [Domibacillus enclensis]OXS75097.1 CYTH domain-containing protein [Domibacillus enclensis]SIR43004.1 adenylate cyclase [Domibacillus enclensis]
MNEEIEIEFKCVVTKTQFETLVAALKPGPFQQQHNHYFDTPDFLLKQAGAALRIREKNSKMEMTLKEPADTGLLESTVPLSKQETEDALKGLLPDNDVIERAAERSGAANFVHFGTLSTTRAEMSYEGGLLVFDYSTYLGREDYEMEYEAKDASGEAVFHALLTQYDIDYIPAQNKIRRFYEALHQDGGN